MRNYSTNTSINDFLFIMLCGFMFLLFIAFMLINPIAKDDVFNPKAKIIVLMEWPKKSIVDIDMWVRGPTGNTVHYANLDGKYMILSRDDLGVRNDTVLVDGKLVTVERNVETLLVTKRIPGEYVINVHSFSTQYHTQPNMKEEKYPTPVKVKIIQVDPYKVIYDGEVTLNFRAEKTIMSFTIDENKAIGDQRTDIQIPLMGHERKDR